MSDRSEPSDAAPRSARWWLSIKKAASRLQDWFVIQPASRKLMVLAMLILIPATGIYSFILVQKQAKLAKQAMTMAVAGHAGDGVWTLNDKLPIVLGAVLN